MSTIRLRGPWAVWWGVWHAAWLFGLFWIPWFAADAAPLYFRVLYTAFLAPEIAGAIVNGRRSDSVARTLSETRQWVAQTGKGPGAVGWKGLAAGTAFVDAAVVYWIVRDADPVVGAVLGCVVWLWLGAHFGYRERVG